MEENKSTVTYQDYSEGDVRIKKIQDQKIQDQIEEENEQRKDGVRIKFSDEKEGREVYTYQIIGLRGEKKEKAIDILIHEGISVKKFPLQLAEKMVEFFNGRASIIE